MATGRQSASYYLFRGDERDFGRLFIKFNMYVDIDESEIEGGYGFTYLGLAIYIGLSHNNKYFNWNICCR